MALADFIHLRTHSAYSLAAGAIKIKDLTGLCKKHAMPAVAVTDSGNLFGALEFSAVENVMMPQMIAGRRPVEARRRAEELLTMVGLAERASHRPSRLSGGEQQRVAIVRALANGPAMLLGDEPTGNLDQHTAESVISILVDTVRKVGLGALIATHNLDLARRMDRILVLEDGMLVQRNGIT